MTDKRVVTVKGQQNPGQPPSKSDFFHEFPVPKSVATATLRCYFNEKTEQVILIGNRKSKGDGKKKEPKAAEKIRESSGHASPKVVNVETTQKPIMHHRTNENPKQQSFRMKPGKQQFNFVQTSSQANPERPAVKIISPPNGEKEAAASPRGKSKTRSRTSPKRSPPPNKSVSSGASRAKSRSGSQSRSKSRYSHRQSPRKQR